jgi:flagellar assembly protein FliH
MAAPAKFLFDMDFSAPDKTRERPPPSEVAQRIAEAEARAIAPASMPPNAKQGENDRRAARKIGVAMGHRRLHRMEPKRWM